jgi:hypothetical protein
MRSFSLDVNKKNDKIYSRKNDFLLSNTNQPASKNFQHFHFVKLHHLKPPLGEKGPYQEISSHDMCLIFYRIFRVL